MPIMAAHERSDARGAARLLAHMALECIDNPKAAVNQEVALNNVYRLLESYRSNAFFGIDAPRQPFRRFSDKLALTPPRERHVRDVREAIERARLEVFSDQPKDQAIESVERVLRALAYPQKERFSADDKKRASRFFKALLEWL
jgi:hypothetical protein